MPAVYRTSLPGTSGVDGVPQPLRIRLNRPEVPGKHFLESAGSYSTVYAVAPDDEDFKGKGLYFNGENRQIAVYVNGYLYTEFPSTSSSMFQVPCA